MSILETLLSLIKSFFSTKQETSNDVSADVSTSEQSVSTNTPTNTPSMSDSVFSVMVSGETDANTIASIKNEMLVKNAIGVFPYTITTDNWIYTINLATDKYGNDYTDKYGLQYTATPKTK